MIHSCVFDICRHVLRKSARHWSIRGGLKTYWGGMLASKISGVCTNWKGWFLQIPLENGQKTVNHRNTTSKKTGCMRCSLEVNSRKHVSIENKRHRFQLQGGAVTEPPLEWPKKQPTRRVLPQWRRNVWGALWKSTAEGMWALKINSININWKGGSQQPNH